MRVRKIAAVAAALLASATLAFAAEHATKDEAVAMVKKAVVMLKADGTEKGYVAISTVGGAFTDRDLYVVVLNMEGVTLAHGANSKLIGKNLMAIEDIDGKYFVKAMIESSQKQASFWEDYKFTNPVTKKVEPKEMYCERLDATIVCAGIYKS